MAVTPSRVNFDNVTSLGVSYNWSHGAKDGAALPCSGISDTPTGKWIERVKTVSLEVANLDLSNAGGSVISQMAAQQSKYVNTATHSIYANGNYAGNGYLTDYSINEGSLSNASVTNLTYTMRDGGEDPNQADDENDPVTRNETIRVSRDIKGKSYTIDHSYSINYGSDFDLVTDYPLYSGDPNYKSVDGRLAIGEQEALKAVNQNVRNYNNFIDLSPYTLSNGFDFSKINDGCSGVFTSSNETKNYINGDYSYSKQTVLRYTGVDLTPELDLYEIDYSINWEQKKDPDFGDCLDLTFRGSIMANMGTVQDCSDTASGAGEIAQQGFEEWVTNDNPKGAAKVKEFFDAISGNLALPGATNYPLVDKILNYKKDECVPSVNKGAQNNGKIDFEFTMTSCPETKQAEGTQYDESQSVSVSYSKGGCDGAERRITEITVDGDIQGRCGQNRTPSGVYQKWESISGIFETTTGLAYATGLTFYSGSFEDQLRLSRQSTSINKYEGQGSYSFDFTDSALNENCDPVATTGCNPDFSVSVKNTETPSIKRYVNTVTVSGIVSEQKGETLPKFSSSINIENKIGENITTPLDVSSIMEETRCQLDINKPHCVIQDISINLSKSQTRGIEKIQSNSTIGGIGTGLAT